MGISSNLNSRVVALSLFLALSTIPAVGETSERRDGLVSSLAIGPATVGELSQIRWSLSDSDTGKPVPFYLTLSVKHLEKKKRIFYLNKIAMKGNFALGFHFVDGSAHRVSAVAEVKGRGPVKEEQVVTVAGVEPPLKTAVPALLFFLGIIALGIIAGRISRLKSFKR